MAKMDQVLSIDPAGELTFCGPFTSAVSSVMRLTNPSERRVCFKIKTTAPKRYCVKPNSGIVEQGQTVSISVSLQPFEFDPMEKNKHKFMVQSMFAPEGEINLESLWKETDPSALMDSKLKCVFVMPDGPGGVTSDVEINNIKSDFGGVMPKQSIPPSPKNIGDHQDYSQQRTAVEEIKKLQEEISVLRQENIQLKEEALRQKRLTASRNVEHDSSGVADPSRGGVSGRAASGSAAYSSMVVTATNPNANALFSVYLYVAVVVLILGVILGKWVF